MENETIGKPKKPKGHTTTLMLTAENYEYVCQNMHWKFTKAVNAWLDEKRQGEKNE